MGGNLVYTSDQTRGKAHRKKVPWFSPNSSAQTGRGTEPSRGGGNTVPQDTWFPSHFTGFGTLSPQGSAGKGGSSLGTGFI